MTVRVPMIASPRVGGSRPSITRKRVVLPRPLRPTMPRRWPSSSFRLTPSKSVRPSGRSTPTFFNSITRFASLGAGGMMRSMSSSCSGAACRGEFVVAVHAVAGLGGARGRAAPDPFEFALEELLAAGFLGLVVGLAQGLAFEEGGVVALVGEERAVSQFHDAGGYAVEEVAVVRDEQASARIRLEELFQPFDGLHVEMVGRLVEDEQVGLGQQRAAERDASFFPARETAREPVGGGGAQVVDERADTVFDLPAVEVVDVVEQFAGAVGVRRLVLVLGDEVQDGLRAGEDVLFDGLVVVQLEILRQVARDEFAASDDLARVGRDDPGGDAQERALARAVAADQADAVALVDGERGLVEDRLHAVARFEVGDAEDGGRHAEKAEGGRRKAEPTTKAGLGKPSTGRYAARAMKFTPLCAACLVFLLMSAAKSQGPAAERPEFRELVPEGAAVEKLAGGFGFTEGPAWNPVGEFLVFSDIPASRLYRFDAASGKTVVFREATQSGNGNIYDQRGNLYTCAQDARRVIVQHADGTVEPLPDRCESKLFTSPNDVVVKNDGTVWFTDPTYGPARYAREQPANRVYCYDPGTHGTHAVADGFDQPNGLCFSPDETRLYVADSGRPHNVRVFDVSKDGQLSKGRVFCAIDKGVPDGMRCDRHGNLFTTAEEGVQVFNPAGERLGMIPVPETPANLCFGGPATKDHLYITARTSLYKIRLNTTAASTAREQPNVSDGSEPRPYHP